MKVFGVKQSIKSRTSLRITDGALEQIKASMADGGYGVRERSKWICEAVIMLFALDSYWEVIVEEFMDEGGNELIPVTIDSKTSTVLSAIELEFLQHYSSSLIDMSLILRAAITHRLVKEGGGTVTI